MRFVALNVCSSTQKGAELLVEALTGLSQRGLDGRYRVSVYGPVAPHVHAALVEHPSVDLHGAYGIDQLDQLLEPADVGLLPSVWEEVYGFVGLELLAKGIPVIGNAIGAIPEYVLPGQTGWLNRSCSATELAELMASAIDNPAEVRRLSDKTVELRTQLIRPFDAGLGAIETVYREVIARRGPG
jgi:glycosyltransferase involved in cell wall biosynthesis